MAIGNHNDLTHIVRTSDQWKNTYDKYELIPTGVLCVELVSSDVTKIKIGDGHNIFSKLPYIGDLDLSKYYTKLETDTRIKEILTQEKVVRIKGIVGSKSDLPADARCGNIYFVRQLSSSDNKYIEYIYSPDNTWEPLGGIPVDIDLSEYAKTAYVDDKIEQVNERIDDIEQHGTHTHPNKEILDQITEPYTTADKETLASLHNYDDTEIREMISQSSHTHDNKDILDATSAAFTKEDKSKLDQLNPYDDSVLKEKITALERLAHEHSNKRILDQTTASFTKEYERKMRWIRIYTGCTGMEEGIAGLVPAAQAGEEDYVLSGSGEWVPQTGGGGTYTLPIATASTLGGIKVGDGLSIDPATGVLSATGGGGGGDSIAEGDGITITTDPQTGVKTISVDTGNGLQINQDGEVEIDPSIIPDSYDAGNGIQISQSTHTDEFNVQNQEYFFDTRGLTCGLNARVWTTVNDGDILAAMCIHNNGGNQVPLFVGVTEDSVKVSQNYDGNILGPNGSFDYLGKTWYFTADYALSGTDGQDTQGHIQTLPTTYSFSSTPSNFVPAAKDLIDLAVLLPDTLHPIISAKIGAGLSFDANGAIQADAQPLSPATDSTLGGVIVGEGINVDEYGEISLSAGEGLDIDFALPIPSEYTLVKGISSVGHNDLPYINTGYLIKPTSRIIARGVLYKTNSGWAFPIGVRHNNYANPVMFCTRHNSNGDSIELWLPNDTLIATATDREKCYNDPVTITISSDGLNIENETTGEVVTLTTSDTLPTASLPLYIFATNDNYTIAFPGPMDLYRLQIFEGTTKVLDYLPCKRNSDNKYGVYDIVANEYKASSNAASFEPVAGTPSGDDLIQQIKLLPATENTIGGVKPGDGILVDNDGTISVDPDVIPEILSYEGGTAISVVDNNNPYITKVRWTISDIRGTSDSWIQMRYFGFYNENQDRLVIQSGLSEWSDDSTVTYYQHRTLNAMINNQYEMTASSWDGTKSFILTFNLPSGTRLSDLKYFRYQTGDDETHRDPVSWEIHAYSEELDAWLLLNTETNATIPTNRNAWTGYFDLEYVPVKTIDAWNSGTGWGNFAYTSGSSDSTSSWNRCVHSPVSSIDNLFPVLSTKIKVIARDQNDGLLSVRIELHTSAGRHYGCYEYSQDEEIIDLKEFCESHSVDVPTYVSLGLLTLESPNYANISPSDVSRADIIWYTDIISPTKDINVKYGDGLTVNQDNELEVNLGSGLQFDANGAIEVVGGGGGGSGDYTAGDAIEFRSTQLSFNVDAIRWDISEIKNNNQSGGGGTTWTQVRYIEFCDDSGIPYTISSASGIWEDNISITYSTTGGSQTINDMIANTQKMCAVWRYPNHTMQLTFNLDTAVPCADIAKFRIKLGDDVPERDPKSWKVYFRDAATQIWYIVQDITDAELSNTRDIWSNYYSFDITGATSINVKYGTGLAIDPITGELFVDGQLPEGTIIKKMTYMGDGNNSRDITFEKKPIAILNIYGAGINTKVSACAAPIDAPVLNVSYGDGSNHSGMVTCNMSYNDSTNTLTLSGGIDAGARCNMSGETYIMFYLTKGHAGSGTSETNMVSVVKTFSYVGTGTTINNIQFPETPNLVLSIIGENASPSISVIQPIEIEYPGSMLGECIVTWGNGTGGSIDSSLEWTFNDTTNILSLLGDTASHSSNISGKVYVVRYVVNEVIATTMPYAEGEAISIETIGGLQPTDYSNNDFVTSITSINGGTIVKAADNSSFTLTASSNDCYTQGSSMQSNGSYPYNVKASTKYRFAWDSANPDKHGQVYVFENGQYGDMMHSVGQHYASYIEFTTTPQTTYIQARFGVEYAGQSITYSNVRLYEVIEDEDQYNEISVKHGDGLSVNERNELEVNYGNGLEIVSNSQYRSKYYFNTQVQCKVHTDNYYSTSTSFDRIYQKTTTDPALCCIWEVGDSGALWTGPLLVGTTATSVQYTTQDTSQTVNYQNTFTYLGQTWYTSGYPDFLNAADHEDKFGYLQYLGSYAAVTDQIQAAKDLINLALINAGSLQAKLGNGLRFDANGAIEVTGGGGGGGDTVAQGNGINITTDQQTGDKVIAVNAGSGLAFDQTTHALEVSSGVVTSIAPTQNTPGSITVTEGDGTATPVQVVSQMGGATSSTAGTAGYVPAPASGDNDAYLRGDGTWDDDVVTENDLLTLVFVPDDYTPPTP